ncbi:MAG: DUF4469 domain-containing protein [Anaerolineae bacterium]|nr:DUF4469 domain-containing protein [Anaerolineae bacterium]
MAIDYKLYEYNLPSGADYRAKVDHSGVIDLDGVIEEMTIHHTGISQAIMVAVFREFLKTLVYLLIRGNKVVTPFAVFSLTIKGPFTSPDDQFDRQRHRLEIAITPGDELESGFAGKARTQKKPVLLRYPTLNQCTDAATDTTDSLTPGRMASLKGLYLKFDERDPSQGIFLTSVSDPDSLDPLGPPVRVEDIGHNKGRKLVFGVPPDLPPGLYRLEVRARFGKHTLRTGHLDKVLRVA